MDLSSRNPSKIYGRSWSEKSFTLTCSFQSARIRRAMQRIAIMQGRLLPPQDGRFQCFPRDCWREEFPLAAAAGLNAIEWIYDLHGADVNPLGSDSGIEEMQALARHHKIDVVS